MRPRPLASRLAATLLLAILPSGCFTGMVWGFTPEDDPNTCETEFAYDKTTEWSWELFFKRLLVTPFSVGLDVLTCPIQALVYGCDDDKKNRDKDPHQPRHKH